MKLVLLDLNALIGMQDPKLRSLWEPILSDANHLLVVTDHTFLEACKAGPDRVEAIFRPLVPYRNRVRGGRRHSELFRIEAVTSNPIRKSDLITANGTRILQEALDNIERGRTAFAHFWHNPEIVQELNRRLNEQSTADLIRSRYDSLRDAVQEREKQEPPPKKGDMSLGKKFRTDTFDEGRIELCTRLAAGLAVDQLEKEGVHWMKARVAKKDGFCFRHELAYWLRCLQLIQNNLLANWDQSGNSGKLVNEHFDVEYVAMASIADLAACKDDTSRDTLAMMDLALTHCFKRNCHVAKAVP